MSFRYQLRMKNEIRKIRQKFLKINLSFLTNVFFFQVYDFLPKKKSFFLKKYFKEIIS